MIKKGWIILSLGFFLLLSLGFFHACETNENNDDDDDNDVVEDVPAAPDNLNAQAHDSDIGVDLTWQDNSDNESGFVLERKLNVSSEDSFAQILADLNPNTSSFTDSDPALEAGNAYNYRIKAFNDAGDSAYSDTAYVYIPPEGNSLEQVMTGLIFAAYAATDNRLWYTPMDAVTQTNYIARYEITDTGAPPGGQQYGTDISADYDPSTGFLYVAYVDIDNKLWYTAMDTINPTNYTARYEITDTGAPPGGQQYGTAISVDYDPESKLLYVGYADLDDRLWYTTMDTENTTNYTARYEITDTGAPPGGQQYGT
ncbi:MAG: fibronectin type III domain-containing protein, partial [Spirochaetales bacterium]|nr:fibronectin type III domain-containing protein [Spirochaetales bacterium]